MRVLDGESGQEMFGGTLAYMAPEHLDAFRGAEGASIAAVSERADIYSLGMVLFEMLAGERAFGSMPSEKDGSVLAKLLAEQRRSQVPSARSLNPDVPEYLDAVVSRCLMPSPEDRYVNARVLASSLDGCRERASIANCPCPVPSRLALRYPFALLGLFCGLAACLGASSTSLTTSSKSRGPHHRTESDFSASGARLQPDRLPMLLVGMLPAGCAGPRLRGRDHDSTACQEPTCARAPCPCPCGWSSSHALAGCPAASSFRS